MSARPSNNYPCELRERAIPMFGEIRPEYTSDWAAAQPEADKLGHRWATDAAEWCARHKLMPVSALV